MYDTLIIDSLNLAYRVFDKGKQSPVMRIASRSASLPYVRSFIEIINYLKSKYLTEGGEIYLLFDNPTSREEIRNLFKPLPASVTRKAINRTYKANRTKESPLFYASVDAVKYYYTISDRSHRVVQIANLEADDLVFPCIQFTGPHKKILLVTNDSDWCKYISDSVHYLPDLYAEPRTREHFFLERGFYPTEEKIILEKLLEGDKADNIASVFPEFPPLIRNLAIKDFEGVQGFVEKCETIDYMEEWAHLVKERIPEIKSAYQMLATIPVSFEQFKYNCIIGRDAKRLVEGITSLVFEKKKNDGFEFGGLKTPRVQPKG